MSNDETYLEYFIESIATLPSEMRRNLAHMKVLDKSCSSIVEELRDTEEDYLRQAHDSIYKVPIKTASDLNNSKKRQREDDGRLGGSSKNDKDVGTERDTGGDCNNRSFWHKPNQGVPVVDPTGTEKTLVVPTSEELRSVTHKPADLLHIATLRREARQLTEEKVAISEQSYGLLDAAIKRLDTDLEKFEVLLKNTGQYEAGGAQPDDLAAIQVTPNSPDWILAKVISHDPQTQMYSLSDEDIESNKSFILPESQVVILGGDDRISKGDIIYAVYPDTTSFYQAAVVQAPKKIPGQGDSFVLLHFKDDGDENGITHPKKCLMKHIMRVPYGAIQ